MATIERLICASEAVVERGDGVRFDVGAEAAFVIRFDGKVHAFLNRCAHLPMELDWLAGKFFDNEGGHLVCSTHGATYDPVSGRCVGGPCRGGGLARLAVFERDRLIYLKEEGDG